MLQEQSGPFRPVSWLSVFQDTASLWLYPKSGGYAMNLKKIRNEKSLSIRALSELADVPKRTIEDIERFDRCKVDTAIKLADALQVTLDELCRNTADTE